jgi:hypothetical protein
MHDNHLGYDATILRGSESASSAQVESDLAKYEIRSWVKCRASDFSRSSGGP